MNIDDSIIDNIEFRMDLIFQNTDFTRFIYECKLTEEQLKKLYNLMDGYRSSIGKGKEVSSALYETKVLEIVDNKCLDYHFCESFARLLWEEQRYEEVFESLYKDSQKFSHLFEK